MNTAAKKIYSLALILTGVFTLLCTGFYTFALTFEYSPLTGHFSEGAFSDIFLPLLYMLVFVAFALLGIVFRDTLSGRKTKTTLPLLFASAFAALATAVWLVTFILDFFAGDTMPIATVFGILLVVFGITTVYYFISSAFPFTTHRQSILFGMGAAAFMLIYAFFAYFDTAFALNSPIKLLDQLTAIVLLFFFLAEIRFRFGTVSEALFLPICMLATTLAASTGIAALIYNVVSGTPLIVNVMHDFLFFGIAVYAFVRLLSFLLPEIGNDENASSPVMPAFEAEQAPSAQGNGEPTQETFDFDSTAENTVANDTSDADVEEDSAEDEVGVMSEAALDLDESQKM